MSDPEQTAMATREMLEAIGARMGADAMAVAVLYTKGVNALAHLELMARERRSEEELELVSRTGNVADEAMKQLAAVASLQFVGMGRVPEFLRSADAAAARPMRDMLDELERKLGRGS